MKTACFIPIKAPTPGGCPKRTCACLCGRKLYEYICIHARQAGVFDGLYVDTDSPEVAEYARAMGFTVIPRAADLARDDANGNDLLVHHWQLYPNMTAISSCLPRRPFCSRRPSGPAWGGWRATGAAIPASRRCGGRAFTGWAARRSITAPAFCPAARTWPPCWRRPPGCTASAARRWQSTAAASGGGPMRIWWTGIRRWTSTPRRTCGRPAGWAGPSTAWRGGIGMRLLYVHGAPAGSLTPRADSTPTPAPTRTYGTGICAAAA